MKFRVEVAELRTRDPFTIARGGGDRWPTVIVEAEEAGLVAYGEGAPREYYGEDPATTAETVRAWLADRRSLLDVSPQAVADEVEEEQAAARAALDLLLHDLHARRRGLPMVAYLAEHYGLGRAQEAPLSSFTIGLDTTARMVEKAEAAGEYPVLKVKLGTDRDLEIVEALRAATEAQLRVDANAAWSVAETRLMAPELARLGVTLLEQPLGRYDLEGYRQLRRSLPLPVFADESCRHPADVERLRGAVDGVNLKLGKNGGLWPAVQMLHSARAQGMAVMLGCFVESSVSITAAAALAHYVDHADLDGAALLAADPFAGATIPGGRITLPRGPGLAVSRRQRG